MKARSVPSPLGYLHNLVKAARAGRLNRSVLQKQPVPTPTPIQTTANTSTPIQTASASASSTLPEALKQRLWAISEEIRSLDRLFAFAGEPMDSKTAAKKAQLVAEYQRLLPS